MAVSLGSHVFGCDYHTVADVAPAPKAEARYEVAGLNGVGLVDLGQRSRPIQVTAAYRGYASETLLVAAIAADEAKRGVTEEELIVGGTTIADCRMVALAYGPRLVDGKNGLWFAPRVIYLFEQLNA